MGFEQLLPFEAALAGRKILVTGHTGFTGGWARTPPIVTGPLTVVVTDQLVSLNYRDRVISTSTGQS